MVRRLLLALVIWTLPTIVWAQAASVGDTITLKATHPDGVPLHRHPRPSMFGRAPDGSQVSVLDVANQGNWLKITNPAGGDAWIVKKYVDGIVSGGGSGTSAATSEADAFAVWHSEAECLSVVNAGRRMVATDPAKLRIATWNIRWFPDGDMHRTGTKNTDVGWLACTLAWLNADIVALEEIRNHDEAQDAQTSLLDGLTGLTGDDWRLNLQACGGGFSQHVGFLWNASRVTLNGFRDIPELNGKHDPGESACTGSLRPGLYAFASVAGGVDFHIIAVHLDSGTSTSDHTNRDTAIGRIDDVARDLTGSGADSDIIVLGDFNTMGFGDPQSAATEIAALTDTANTGNPRFRHITIEPQCSEYYDGEGGWLDHILVRQSMTEAPNPTATVAGYCAQLSCARTPVSSMPDAYKRLSDHCPVVLEVNNVDQD